MNQKVKLIVSYKDLSHVDFSSKAHGIVSGLRDNPHFPQPWPDHLPSFATLEQTQKDYAVLVAEAADKFKVTLAARDAKRVVLAGMIRGLASWLELKAHFDRAILESTGYDLHKERRPLPDVPEAPQNLRLRHGQMPGSLVATVDATPGRYGHEAQVCTGDPFVEANWRQALLWGYGRSGVIPNLQRGVDHYVRVRFIGKKPSPWSDLAQMMPV